jgi:hypothetical protein
MQGAYEEEKGVMTELNQTKVETFAGKLMDILNGGMLSLMTSIGHQTGLFEAMADLPPSTSAQIAAVAATSVNG